MRTSILLSALGLALAPVDDPAAALADMVRQGYDTDTVAAICGALFGARFGSAWIPCERLLDLPRLETYADALVLRQSAPEDREGMLAAAAEPPSRRAAEPRITR